ncbi:hypothetical protein D7X30_00505 [Corallococcus sp. AB011P]|uniref:hypothetical protein n=1 Tax=Corallococcus sp. AB011P TaxID=2316735 RepID=UPI000EA40296|nr:hypothetical protein [Corallococcus sp. AB011P]RKG61860.1 hypothetical protein D7X30_00505 [Corallococcus sp. AB011P]
MSGTRVPEGSGVNSSVALRKAEQARQAEEARQKEQARQVKQVKSPSEDRFRSSFQAGAPPAKGPELTPGSPPAGTLPTKDTQDGKANRLAKADEEKAPATSLFTENIQDRKVNCLDQAADFLNKSSPAIQARSEMVFLKDSRGGVEGQAGHVVVRQGGRVLDPSNGKSYEDMKSLFKEQPQYSEAGSIPGTTAAKVLNTEPGSPERAQALADAKISPALQKMMVADSAAVDGGGGSVPNPVTTEPHETTVPGQAGPVSVEFSDTLEKDVKKENGNVTVTITAETTVSASGTVEYSKAKVGGVDPSVTVGAKAGKSMEYEVTMREADYEKLKRGEIAPPHPLNPETIPDGTSLKMEQSTFAGYSLEKGLSYGAAELGLSSEVTKGKGMSIEVSRNGDKLTMTSGPSEFIKNNGKVSLGVGPVSVSAGRADTLKDYKLRTAEFDLSNKDGKKAFESFAKDGRIPEKEGPGVSNTLRIDKVSFESASQLGLDIGPFSIGSEGAKNSVEYLIIHNPDGTKSMTADFEYGGGKPKVTVERKYDKNNNAIESEDKYQLKFDTNQPQAREELVRSFTGDRDKARYARDHKAPITLNLTAADVKEIQRRVAAKSKAVSEPHNNAIDHMFNEDGSPRDPMEAILHMASNPDSNFELAYDWNWIRTDGSGKHLPGTIAIG